MATYTFSNSSGMTLADTATASQGLVVSGMLGTITSVQITLNGLSHTFPLDLDMLLVAPDGTHNLQFWSDAGGQGPIGGGTYSIADGGGALSQFATPTNGTYAPADFETGETMADFGLSGTLNSASTTSLAQAFSGAGNGTWQLYIRDDVILDAGSLAGWGLTITTDDRLVGTSDNDTLSITSTGSGTGSYSLNFGASVDFSGVTVFGFDAGLGDDIVLGSAGDESVRGGGGRDAIALGGGNDFVEVAGGDDVAGENYNGGAGGDELQFSRGTSTGDVVFDLTDDTVAGFESFRFMADFVGGTSVTVKLNAAQFVSAAFYGTGIGDVAEIIDITMQSAATLRMDSTAGLTEAADRIIVHGSTGDDAIYGGAGRDSVDGNGGNDTIYSNGGIDTLRGGANDDTLDLYNHMIVSGMVLDGGTGADTLVIESPNEPYTVDFTGVTLTGIETLVLNAAYYDATVLLSSSQVSFSVIRADSFLVDTLHLNIAMNTSSLNLQALTFPNWNGVVVGITGTNSNETITGSVVGDSINAGGGFDTIKGMGGVDTIDGGAGFDTADYSDKTTSVQVTINAGVDAESTVYVDSGGLYTEDTIKHIENIVGGSAGDKISSNLAGSSAVNNFYGNGGNDTLNGGDGSDFLVGGANDDSLSGGNHDDLLLGGTGKDKIDGGSGSDTADYYDKTTQTVRVDLNGSNEVSVYINGTAAANIEDKLKNVENVLGGSKGDVLIGDGAANRFMGRAGADTMDGDTGSDTADYSDKTQKVTVTLNGSTTVKVYINGTAAANAEDSIKNFENLIGGSSTDKLTGDSLANKFDGQAGSDTLDGKGGNDTLIGGSGNDTLIGGAGIDSLTGGGNDDVFRYLAVSDSTPAARDIITDFDDSGNDRIDLSALFGPTMTYKGTGAFTAAGQVRAYASGADVIVEVNTVGSSGAEFSIKLSATAIGAMGIDDFIL